MWPWKAKRTLTVIHLKRISVRYQFVTRSNALKKLFKANKISICSNDFCVCSWTGNAPFQEFCSSNLATRPYFSLWIVQWSFYKNGFVTHRNVEMNKTIFVSFVFPWMSMEEFSLKRLSHNNKVAARAKVMFLS